VRFLKQERYDLMEILKLEGIIIGEKNYSESSKILDLYTKEYGKVGVISKGCRKMKSKLRAVSAKLVYGDFHIYYKEGKLSTLINVDLKNSFKNIMTDIDKISYVSYLAELTNQVIRHDNPEGLYDLFINCILKINDGLDPLVITNIYELKCLEHLGVKPILDECAVCGSKEIITLSNDKGGLVCKHCKDNNDLIVSSETIKLMRMFYYVDVSKITKLEIEEKEKKEIDHFINEYYDRYTGLYLKSKKFIENLKKIST
jgi:DNA repair protein RecO (recombination protein O)